MSELKTKIWGDTYGVRANWTQASDAVLSMGEDGWVQTGKQVADFRHDKYAALRWVLTCAAAVSGDEAEAADEIDQAIDRAVES